MQWVRRAARRWIFEVLGGDAGIWMYEAEKHNGFETADTAPRTRRLKELLGVGHLKSLEVLQASVCAKLKSILGFDQLT